MCRREATRKEGRRNDEAVTMDAGREGYLEGRVEQREKDDS